MSEDNFVPLAWDSGELPFVIEVGMTPAVYTTPDTQFGISMIAVDMEVFIPGTDGETAIIQVMLDTKSALQMGQRMIQIATQQAAKLN